MKRMLMLAAIALASLTMIAPQAQAQAFIDASNYTAWSLTSRDAVAAGAAGVTIKGFGYVTSKDGVAFTPLTTTAVLSIEAAGGTAESVTPTAVSCAQNGLENTCTFTATFSYSHNAGFRITSGDFGVDEAMNANTLGLPILVRKSQAFTMTGASVSATDFIPANCFLLGVTARVAVTITGATTWDLGTGGDGNLWANTAALTAGTRVGYADYTTATNATGFQASAVTPIFAKNGSNFSGGVVVLTVTYLLM